MSKRPVLKKRIVKKPRSSQTETFLVNQKYLGSEPSFKKGEIADGSKLSNAYNWYNQMCDADEAREYLNTYLASHNRKADIKSLKRVPDNHLPRTCCWIARMLSNGVEMTDKSKNFFEDRLKTAYNHCTVENIEGETPAMASSKINIQDRITDKVNDFIGSIEHLIDTGGSFSVYDTMQKEEFPAKFANRVVNYYQPVVDEYKLLIKGTDKDLNEGYSHLTAKQKKEKLSLFQQIIDDATRYGSNMKKMRKPRKKRPQSLDKKLKHFKYKVEDTSLKIASCNPADIIGAQEVWTYNISQKQLTVLRAIDRGGLDIKRSSIVNFDEKSSVTKRAGRNTDDTIKSVTSGGKITLRKLMDDISSQKIDVNDRVTSNTIILRVVK